MAPQNVPVTDDFVHRLELLEERVRHLELERAPEAMPVIQQPLEVESLAIHMPEATAEELVPLLGKALLALAGAYFLRIVTTSALAPAWLGATLAIAYPFVWMVLATRLSVRSKLTGAVYMAISVLALAPMLWETTVTLQILPPALAASILTAYVTLALALSWKEQLQATAWLAAAAGVLTSIALCFGTHELVAFSAALLVMAAALEFAATRELWLGPRRVVAFAADLVILWLIYVYGRQPEGYPAIPGFIGWGAPAALLLIFIAGTATRTLLRHWNVSVFETFELMAAMGLFVFATTRRPAMLLVPGLLLIVCGVLCYALAFRRLVKESHPWNLYAYSVFGLGLIVLGGWFAFPGSGTAIVYALAALALLWLPLRLAEFHALALAGLAGIASGIASETYGTLLRDGVHVSPSAGALLALAALGLAVYQWHGVTKALAATIFCWITAAWFASLLFGILPAGADTAWRAAIRTSLIAAAAVVVALVARFRHIHELYWLVPGAMIVALGRLVVSDMPVGRPETLFLSLLFYGGALLVLSKLMHGWRGTAA